MGPPPSGSHPRAPTRQGQEMESESPPTRTESTAVRRAALQFRDCTPPLPSPLEPLNLHSEFLHLRRVVEVVVPLAVGSQPHETLFEPLGDRVHAVAAPHPTVTLLCM